MLWNTLSFPVDLAEVCRYMHLLEFSVFGFSHDRTSR